MSNEAQVQVKLNVTVGNYKAQNLGSTFNADVSTAGAAGPTPGSVLATMTGTQIDLSKLTSPGGLALIRNTDSTYMIEVGIYDPDIGRFYTFAELLPGEEYILRLSRYFSNEFGTGTGTEGTTAYYMARVDPTAALGTTANLVVLAHNR